MRKHYVYSDNSVNDEPLLTLEVFDKDKIKQFILDRLKEYPNDTLTHEKESIDKKYVGNDILGFYGNNKNGTPCRIIPKGSKEYFKPLTTN